MGIFSPIGMPHHVAQQPTVYFLYGSTAAFILVSWNAAVGPYKNKSLNKCDNTIII